MRRYEPQVMSQQSRIKFVTTLLKGDGDTVLDAVLKTFLMDDKGNM